MELHIIRHTQTEVPDGICFGQSDVLLRSQWKEDLAQVRIDRDYATAYSSPLKRCTCLAEFFGLKYIKDSRLTEMSFGDWEMKCWEDIPPAEIQPWYKDFVHTQPPNGETLLSLQQRVLNFFKEIQNLHANDKILIISHSGVIRLFLQEILGFPLENMFRIQPQHGKKMILRKEKGLWKIEGMNW